MGDGMNLNKERTFRHRQSEVGEAHSFKALTMIRNLMEIYWVF